MVVGATNLGIVSVLIILLTRICKNDALKTLCVQILCKLLN